MRLCIMLAPFSGTTEEVGEASTSLTSGHLVNWLEEDEDYLDDEVLEIEVVAEYPYRLRGSTA